MIFKALENPALQGGKIEHLPGTQESDSKNKSKVSRNGIVVHFRGGQSSSPPHTDENTHHIRWKGIGLFQLS